jgi:hypothetical protein
VTTARKTLPRIAAVLVLAAAGCTATAHADDPPPPPAHRVKYTVTADKPIRADIYYLDNEPPHFAAWSHDPYQWMPKIRTDLSPGQPWVFELMLDNPDQWAMVTASSGLSQLAPMFHCNLTVDGAVVMSKDGPKGVLCSLRGW